MILRPYTFTKCSDAKLKYGNIYKMKLQIVDNNIKYWVVRAGTHAKFYEHFKQNEIVSLGHIDEITNENGILKIIDPEKLTTLILDNITSKKKQIEVTSLNSVDHEDKDSNEPSINQISSTVSQVNTFVNEMKIGDVIITLNDKYVLVGTIKSESYIDNTTLIAYNKLGTALERKLSYKLRRKIEWNTPKERSTIPKPIRATFNAHQTIFSISDTNEELLLHWLYGMYQKENSLFFSTKIEEKNRISQFNLTEFQRAIQKLELIAEKISKNNLNLSNDIIKTIDEQYIRSGLANEFTLSTKNSFMSPGNIWSEVRGDAKKLAVFSILLGLLFNVDVEASSYNISEKELSVMIATTKALKEPNSGNFDLFRDSIDANLEKPNISSKK